MHYNYIITALWPGRIFFLPLYQDPWLFYDWHCTKGILLLLLLLFINNTITSHQVIRKLSIQFFDDTFKTRPICHTFVQSGLRPPSYHFPGTPAQPPLRGPSGPGRQAMAVVTHYPATVAPPPRGPPAFIPVRPVTMAVPVVPVRPEGDTEYDKTRDPQPRKCKEMVSHSN